MSNMKHPLLIFKHIYLSAGQCQLDKDLSPERAMCTSVGQRPTINDEWEKALKGRNDLHYVLSGLDQNIYKHTGRLPCAYTLKAFSLNLLTCRQAGRLKTNNL